MKKILRPFSEGRLLAYLIESLPDLKRNSIKKFLKFSCVSVNGKMTTQFDHPLRAGDEVAIVTDQNRPATPSKRFNLEIVYEDDGLIVINKPAGLLTIGSEKVQRETAIFTLNDYLQKKQAARSKDLLRYKKLIFVVHRIDRDVSGLLLFAKDHTAQFSLQKNWNQVRKEYDAVVEGFPKEESGTLVSCLHENQSLRVTSGPRSASSKKAVTHYRVIKTGRENSLLRIHIETGRKHQIRVQLADLGCPIVGDKTYGAKTNPLRRIALQACRLAFQHPVTGAALDFSLPLPIAFESLLS